MSRGLLLVLLVAAVVVAGCLGAPDDAGTSQGSDQPDQAQDPPDEEADPPDDEADDGAPGDDGEYAPGWPDASEAAIRPGVTVADGACTSNFLFRSPDNRTLYLGTAAHCFQDAQLGAPVTVAGGYQGTLAYSSFVAQHREEGEVVNDANDFALIELPDGARDEVHPAVRDAGGPTGIATDVAGGDRVLAYGNSTVRPDAADAVRPREGYVTGSDEWTTDMYLAGPGVPGDSGSAVLTADGQALGLVITLEILPEAASNNAANLDAVLPYANEHSDRTFELVTWDTVDEPMLPAISG